MNKIEKQSNNLEINFKESIQRIWTNKRIIFKTGIVGLIIGIVIAFSIPPQYTVNVTFSPENSEQPNNSLNNVTSFLNIGSMGMNKEGINVGLTPNIISSTPFLLEVSNMTISINDNQSISINKYIEQQKQPWWNYLILAPQIVKRKISNVFTKEDSSSPNINIPYKITQEEYKNIILLQKAITCKIDNKTNLTTLSISMQNADIATIVADSVISKLEQYIVNYKTKKAIEYYKSINKIFKEYRSEYYKAQQAYATFIDNNRNINWELKKIKATRLENELQLAYQMYSQISNQRQIALTKIQEEKPILTIIEPPFYPLSPSSPNKVFIILGCLFLTIVFIISWITFGKDLYNDIKATINKY